MRFFSGGRSDDKRKGFASNLYKQKLLGKKPPELTREEKYKQALNKKINALMMEVAKEKKKSFKLPGTKEEEKKQPSRHFMETMEKLAQVKIQKEVDRQRKKQRAAEFAKKAEKRAKIAVQKAEDQKKLDAQKQTPNTLMGTYWFGGGPDNKNGGW